MKRNSKNAALPPYVTHETPVQIQIVYNLSGGTDSHLQVMLSEDKSRLHVVGERSQEGHTDEFLWSFALPKSVDTQHISVDVGGDIYMINLPKKSFWANLMDSLTPELHPQFASAM